LKKGKEEVIDSQDKEATSLEWVYIEAKVYENPG